MRLLLLCTVFSLSACASVGPVQSSLLEDEATAQPEAPPAAAPALRPLAVEGSAAPAAAVGASPEAPTPPAEESPPAPPPEVVPDNPFPKSTPFAAGVVFGVGLNLDGSKTVAPMKFATFSVKLADLDAKGRSVSAVALADLTGSTLQKLEGAFGAGASCELTPGNFPYKVDGLLGVAFRGKDLTPVGFLGFNFQGKI